LKLPGKQAGIETNEAANANCWEFGFVAAYPTLGDAQEFCSFFDGE
jgi:hypothetical protein